MKRKGPITYFDIDREILSGRREIMAFLKVRSWSTVRRYRKRYHLPILMWPSGRPIAFKSELLRYLIRFNEIMEEDKKNKQ